MTARIVETVPLQRCCIVIPARKHSTRLANKLLLRVDGKTILQHTYEAASRSALADQVWVAADHADIIDEVQRFGGLVMSTSTDCQSGTDRVAQVARQLREAEIVVNVQGDEPDVDALAVDRLIELLKQNQRVAMATLAAPLRSPDLIADPACVKVVFDDAGRALYFSRSPIPCLRDGDALSYQEVIHYQHIGVYAYRREFLLKFAAAPPTRLEQIEKLEQLRALEMGETISVEVVSQASRGIDTPADYEAFVARRRAG